MEKNKYLSALNNQKTDPKKTEEILKLYNTELPKIPKKIQQIISYGSDSVFFDDGGRTLSFSEIVNADAQLHVDFTKKELLPLVDCGDNDFIVYNIRTQKWSKFNIVDEISFKEKSSFEELLRSIK